jgi:GNAT superfamily N-acetyltransferase
MSNRVNPIYIQRVHVERVIDLRHRVLRAGLPRDTAYFESDDGPHTVHLAALDDEIVIGCATVLLNSWNGNRACQLRGMAVDPSYERAGIGRLLLEEADRVATEAGAKILWANARKLAIGFYQKLGWKIESEEFEIPTAGPHFKIAKVI